MGTGLLMYVSDYDGRLPDRDDWMDAAFPYLKREQLFHCPSLQETKNPAVYGYAFNGKLSRTKHVENDAVTPMIFESINVARNSSGNLESLPNPGRHRGQNVIGYMDSHVKRIPNPPIPHP